MSGELALKKLRTTTYRISSDYLRRSSVKSIKVEHMVVNFCKINDRCRDLQMHDQWHSRRKISSVAELSHNEMKDLIYENHDINEISRLIYFLFSNLTAFRSEKKKIWSFRISRWVRRVKNTLKRADLQFSNVFIFLKTEESSWRFRKQ